MRLTIDLTDTEAANIAGWCNFYLSHPEQTPTPIVLEDRSQERLRAIAAQFGAAPAPEQPPGNGTVAEKWQPAEQERKVAVSVGAVTAIPFTCSGGRVQCSINAPGARAWVGISRRPFAFEEPLVGAAMDAYSVESALESGDYYCNVKIDIGLAQLADVRIAGVLMP